MITLTEDKLNRKKFLDNLFNLFENFGNYNDGGLTISINGKYGNGKSTLLNFIEEKNSTTKKYNIVKYNAWENNLFANPLIPILYVLNGLTTPKYKLKDAAKNIVKKLPRLLTISLPKKIGLEIDLSALYTNSNFDIFDKYKNYLKAINNYKDILKDFCNKKKTIILIDELDRCLPEYQIKVLETLYHIFNIPNLILIIAIDKLQLEHTIKQMFGEQTNVSTYLSKFIQYEIDLPEDQNNFYYQTLISFPYQNAEIKNSCVKMFEIEKIPVRDSMQVIKELNLICNGKTQIQELIQHFNWYPLFICLILIIKKLYNLIYKKYFYNDMKDIIPSTNKVMLNQTLFFKFLEDTENTNTKLIFDYFSVTKSQFILYFIDYFYDIEYIDIDSLIQYTHFTKEQIERTIQNNNMHSWNRYDYDRAIDKIRIFN